MSGLKKHLGKATFNVIDNKSSIEYEVWNIPTWIGTFMNYEYYSYNLPFYNVQIFSKIIWSFWLGAELETCQNNIFVFSFEIMDLKRIFLIMITI